MSLFLVVITIYWFLCLYIYPNLLNCFNTCIQKPTLPLSPSQNSGMSHSDWRSRHIWLESNTCSEDGNYDTKITFSHKPVRQYSKILWHFWCWRGGSRKYVCMCIDVYMCICVGLSLVSVFCHFCFTVQGYKTSQKHKCET